MKAEEAAAAFEKAYDAELGQYGSYRQASLLMGRPETYLRGQLRRGEMGVRCALRGLEVMGAPMPEEVFHTAFCRLDTDPVRILEAARERQAMEPDVYFRGLAPRLKKLAEAGATAAGGQLYSRAGKIAHLDKLRRSDRHQAKAKLQRLISGLVERMESTGERPPQSFGELAWALGVLAVIQRYAGRRGDAVDILVLAWPLGLLADQRMTEGDWFLRAAFLLVDLNREARAYQFLHEASGKYLLAGSIEKQLMATVTRAYVLTDSGRHAASRTLLLQVLPLLAEDQVEARRFAHETLAKNLQEMGSLSEASWHLSKTISLLGEDLLARGSCLWRQAKLLIALGDTPAALACFAEALPICAKLTGAAELAEMAMDYAKVLVKERRWPELRTLAANLSNWILPLHGTRKLRHVVDDFIALVELNRLGGEDLAEMLLRIQGSKSVAKPTKELPPSDQPQGGNWSPISA